MKTSLSWQSWVNILMIAVLVFIMNIDYTAVNLALVPIAAEMDGDLNTLQWLLSGYVLVWAAFVVPGGRLADLYGKKKILTCGLGLFILGSAVTGWGANIDMLIAGRLFQGIGAALFSAPAYGLIFSSVPPAYQGMAMGIVGGASGLGLATGPSLAGFIILEASWRWLFYINLPLCGVIIGVLIFLSKEKEETQSTRLDYISTFFLAAGLGLTVFALNQIEVWGLADTRLLSALGIGLISLVYFFWRDQQQEIRILAPSLLENKGFMATLTVGFLYSYCFALVLIMMSLYLQNILKLTSDQTGALFLAMTVSLGVLSPIGGKIADRLGAGVPILTGGVLLFLSLSLLCFLTPTSSLWLAGTGLLLAGLGLGLGFPSLNTAMFRTLQPQEINTGSGLFTMSMMLANCMSVIVSTSLLVGVGRLTLAQLELAAGLTLITDQHEMLVGVLSKVGGFANSLADFPHPETVLSLIETAFLQGFKASLGIGIVLVSLGGIITYRSLRTLPAPSSTSSSVGGGML